MVHFLIMKYRCIKRKNRLHSCSVVYSITIGYITQLHYRLKISMRCTAPTMVSVTEPPRNYLTTTIFGRKVNAWSDYLIRCIQSDDFHFVVPYCLYYSYTQMVTYCLYYSYTQSYLGPIAQRATSYENALSFSDYHTIFPAASRGLISIYEKTIVCTIRTPKFQPKALRATWYMDHASHVTCV